MVSELESNELEDLILDLSGRLELTEAEVVQFYEAQAQLEIGDGNGNARN